MEFRAFLIKLFNQLSDTDRRALHFSIGDKIPRQYRDNCTSHGSLQLLDSLFDQNLITEQNFDYLIHIFEQIDCYNASTQLQEYKLYNVRTSIAEPISSVFNESSFNVENDKIQTDIQRQSSQLTPISTESSIELERSMIQSSTITSSEDIGTSDEHETKQLSSTIHMIFKTRRGLSSVILVIITILSIILSLTLLCYLLTQSSSSPLIIKQEMFYIMKEGLQYGTINLHQNQSFNDANDLKLFYEDRCIGVQLRWTNISLISIRFLYSNNRSSNISIIQNKDTTLISSQFISTFMLNLNEEINKINLYQNLYEINFSIIGIQFHTTSGRKSDVFGSNDGHFRTESFEYYTFSYGKGKQQYDKGIEILQFIWIKQTLAKEQIVSVPRSMLEVCEFTFISIKDRQVVYAKGIESSWYDLKRKFDRQDPGCDSTASYYEKISRRGPELFAIVNKTSVFYHDEGEWSKYRSAENITCDIVPWSSLNSS